MKRTKSMIYRPTTESRELYLYAMNKGAIWHSAIEDCLTYARKRNAKNDFDLDKFADLVYSRVCDMANRMYLKDFGYSFSVGDRFTTACDIAKDLFENYL